jgi:hypothetical protein
MAAGLFESFEPQVRFRAGLDRKWRFDFFSHEHQLALEVEGGTFSGGRHSRGVGMLEDAEKYNEACLAGIRVLRFTSTMVDPPKKHKKAPRSKKIARHRALEGCAVDMVRRALGMAFIKKPRRGLAAEWRG